MSDCGRRPFSILRWINYKDGSIKKLQEKLDYIACPKSSPENFRKGYFLNPLFPMKGIDTIHKRYCPVGKRTFKHLVFSLGSRDISPEFAFDVSQQLVQYYVQTYPMLLCLHTNIPFRIHAHVIMSTCSVINGKKFSQSPAEFEAYRQYFNSVMKKNGLPLLKSANIEAEPVAKKRPVLDTDDEFYYKGNPIYYSVPSLLNATQPNQPLIFCQPPQTIQQPNVRVDCKISCDVGSILQNIKAGMTELTLLAKKNRRN